MCCKQLQEFIKNINFFLTFILKQGIMIMKGEENDKNFRINQRILQTW